MTRQEQLKFCKVCQHKGFNPKVGIICSLTNEAASFEETCENYIIDEQVAALENYRKESKAKKVKKAKVKTKRDKEKLSISDIYLILGFSIFTTFLLRLIAYAEFFGLNISIGFFYLLTIYLVIVTLLLVKNWQKKQVRFFHDFKYKIIFSFSLTFFYLLYALLFLSRGINNAFEISFYILVLTLIGSNLSYLMVMPVKFFRIKFTKNND